MHPYHEPVSKSHPPPLPYNTVRARETQGLGRSGRITLSPNPPTKGSQYLPTASDIALEFFLSLHFTSFHFISLHFTSLHFTLLLPYNFAYIYLYTYTHIYRYPSWVPWVSRLEKKPVNATTLHLKAYASSEGDRVELLLQSKFILFTICICYLCLSYIYIYIPILRIKLKKTLDISSQKITSLESSSTNNVPPSADCGIILLVMLRMWLLLGI